MPRAGHAPLRNGSARREKGTRIAVHRRRHGRGAGGRALGTRAPAYIDIKEEDKMAENKHRVALVTGGMGGLGEAICLKLAALGYTVVTTYSPSNTSAKEWLSSMRAQGLNFHAYSCDVSSYESCVECVRRVTSEVGAVEVLV